MPLKHQSPRDSPENRAMQRHLQSHQQGPELNLCSQSLPAVHRVPRRFSAEFHPHLEFGLSQDTDVYQLTTILCEQIQAKRAKAREISPRASEAGHALLGFFLLCLGVICLLAFSCEFFLIRSHENGRSDANSNSPKKTSESQIEGSPRSLAKLWMKQLSPEDNRLLLGVSFCASFMLSGFVLTLWGKNRYLKATIKRLQISWADAHKIDRSSDHQST